MTLYHSFKMKWGFHCPYLAQGWMPTLSTHQALLGDPAERSNLWNADVTQPGVWHLTVVPGNALSSSVSNAPDREERLGGLG